MENIVRYHEKVLDFLIKERLVNPNLFFVPRQRNVSQRLDKGYWFIGNDYYLNVSFWKGRNWKQKIHNIGFVILHNKKSYIDLSSEGDINKSNFLQLIADKIGGFKKENPNRWIRGFKGVDYLENLRYFIETIKPVIDDLIVQQNPVGINLIDEISHNKIAQKVINKRKKQLEYGKSNKLVRICWNREGWKYPSGSNGKSKSRQAFENVNRYGHEEWLFDKTKIFNGYHYGFVESLRLKTPIHYGSTYNIQLFTVHNSGKKYNVGVIKNAHCITPEESSQIYGEYKRLGYLDEMKSQVERVNGNWDTAIFNNSNGFFNIKFKFSDVDLVDDFEEISNADINITTNRMKLLSQKNQLLIETTDDSLPEGNKKSTHKRKKVFKGSCEYDPYHDKIQNALWDYLKASGEYIKVQIEKDRVDLKGLTLANDWHYYEIKTDNPKLSIRKALGQVMEYAFYPDKWKAKKLIVVSDTKPNSDTINYLNFIRKEFSLPIYYRYFKLEEDYLSEDY